MKMTLAVCDLNAAVKALPEPNAHTTICLMAQFARRITGQRVNGSGNTAASVGSNDHNYSFEVDGMDDLVTLFDYARGRPNNIAEIRRQLPREVEVRWPDGGIE